MTSIIALFLGASSATHGQSGSLPSVAAPIAVERLAEIAAWISQNFDLPPASKLPSVALTSQRRIANLHYRGPLDLREHPETANDKAMPNESDILAVYDPTTQTIYLPQGWSGHTPAEVSVVVHEMVHHLQSRGQLKYECPQAREKLAYAVQNGWLDQFGRSLASEFDLDGFTLLVRTGCGL
jgi:hypothetical protein